MTGDSIDQSAHSGNNSVIVQAGRDAIISIAKSPPDIRLVRIAINDDTSQYGCRQKLNVIIKNNGETTAFVNRGSLVVMGCETIAGCGNIGFAFNLSQADWQYGVSIDDPAASFIGQHSIAPNEVVNFDVMVGRRDGGYEVTVYQVFLRLDFDEGAPLETAPFHLEISGPEFPLGGYRVNGPSSEQWGRCMADNIRRLDSIGYDYRPMIDPGSVKYIEAVAPDLFGDDSA